MKVVTDAWREFKGTMVMQNIFLLVHNGWLRHQIEDYKKVVDQLGTALRAAHRPPEEPTILINLNEEVSK